MKVRSIVVGDIITVDGVDYSVLEIGPRNKLEKVDAILLGQGIIAKREDGVKRYFLDIDVDYVNGEPSLY